MKRELALALLLASAATALATSPAHAINTKYLASISFAYCNTLCCRVVTSNGYR